MPAPRRPVFRFAPSPNGALHLGHARSALLNAELAAASGGRLLVRVEDIDPERCRPELIAPMLADLAWLGLRWEEPVRRQSEHMADYAAALQVLSAQGVLYRCPASRKDVEAAAARWGWARDPDGAPRVPGPGSILSTAESARRLEAGAPFALRLDMGAALVAACRAGPLPAIATFAAMADLSPGAPRVPAPAAWGDVVLARRAVPASYHLSVVVDDAVQGVTHVVRGQDLEAATDVHRLLQVLLGLPSPAYHHHALLLSPDGQKLAKRRGDRSLASLAATGLTPRDIINLIGVAPST